MALPDALAARDAALAARNAHPRWPESEALKATKRALRHTVTEATPEGSAEFQAARSAAEALRAIIEDESGYTAAAQALRVAHRDARAEAAGVTPQDLAALNDGQLRAQLNQLERQRMGQRGATRTQTEALRAALLAEQKSRGIQAAAPAREIRGGR